MLEFDDEMQDVYKKMVYKPDVIYKARALVLAGYGTTLMLVMAVITWPCRDNVLEVLDRLRGAEPCCDDDDTIKKPVKIYPDQMHTTIKRFNYPPTPQHALTATIVTT